MANGIFRTRDEIIADRAAKRYGVYAIVSDDVETLKRAVLNLSGKISAFKEAKKVNKELGKIQAIIKEVESLLLK